MVGYYFVWIISSYNYIISRRFSRDTVLIHEFYRRLPQLQLIKDYIFSGHAEFLRIFQIFSKNKKQSWNFRDYFIAEKKT